MTNPPNNDLKPNLKDRIVGLLCLCAITGAIIQDHMGQVFTFRNPVKLLILAILTFGGCQNLG